MGVAIYQRLRHITTRRKFIFSVVIALVTAAIVLGILGTTDVHVLPTGWSTGVPIALAGAAVIVGLFAIPQERRPPADPLHIIGHPPFPVRDPLKVPNEAVQAVYERLIRDNVTGIVLTGIQGAGTTTLAGQVLYFIQERQRRREDYFTALPLWLNVPPPDPGYRVTARTFLEALRPNANFDQVSDLASKLLEVLNDKKRLVIFNQFENLLRDPQTSRADDATMRQWLDKVNNTQGCQCRILITSHLYPRGDDRGSPLHLIEYPVEGLDKTGGVKLLKEHLQRHSIVRVTEPSLCKAVEQCGGHPRSLQLLESFLSATLDKDLDRFLQDQITGSEWSRWINEIATQFLDPSYMQQLRPGTVTHELLLAFSIYREPVTLHAIVPIRDSFRNTPLELPGAAVELARRCLAQVSGGRYKLHPIFITYAWHHFVENNAIDNLEARKQAHEKAAVYLQNEANNCPLQSSERRHLLIEAAWHQLQADHRQEASNLLDADTLDHLLNIKSGGR